MSPLTLQQVATFNRNGFVIIKNFCSLVEVECLLASVQASSGNCHFGKNNNTPWWKIQEENELTCVTHSEKLVRSVARLMDGSSPVCHIQTKTVHKQPHGNSSWAWHQDYAYWHANRLLFPDQIVNFMVALTAVDRTNGCSQVIRASHKMGRLNHGFGDSSQPLGADKNMVGLALETMELMEVELEAGDAVFYHSNLLHRGQANLTGQASWSICSTYASQANLSTNDTYAAWHHPIEVISNEAVLQRQAKYVLAVNEASPNGILKGVGANKLMFAS